MLNKMRVKNFTLFRDETFQFAKGLNVIVGENSSGKSHLLKLAYALIATSSEAKPGSKTSKVYFDKAYAEKLIGVFRPETLGRLLTRKQGRERCEVSLSFQNPHLDVRLTFASNARTDVQVEVCPLEWEKQSPLYLPTRELLTIYPNFISIYDGHYLEFEKTWRDTCIHLGKPLQKFPKDKETSELIEPIEAALGGKVLLDKNGRFYLSIPGSGNMEITLVAEGLRKLAMLAQLISTGVIQSQGYLFWDEPEANLNPRLIRLVAEVIYKLSLAGIQVFIATHSLFLLRELEIWQSQHKSSDANSRFFGLSHQDGLVTVQQGECIEDIGDIAALEESLLQSDRYLAMEV